MSKTHTKLMASALGLLILGGPLACSDDPAPTEPVKLDDIKEGKDTAKAKGEDIELPANIDEACSKGMVQACASGTMELVAKHRYPAAEALAKKLSTVRSVEGQTLANKVADARLAFQTTLDLSIKACNREKSLSCIAAGDLLSSAERRGEAKTHYGKACDQKAPLGCYRSAQLVPDGGERRKLLSEGCRLKHGESCFSLALTIDLAGRTPDAYAALNKACTYQHEGGCALGARVAFEKSDYKKASKLGQAACEKQQMMGCFYQAAAAERNGDSAAALAVLAPHCPGDTHICRYLGQLEYSKGDQQGALKHLNEACKGEDRPACISLAKLQRQAGRYQEALASLRQLCETGHGASCLGVAQMLEEKSPPKPDPKAAKKDRKEWDLHIKAVLASYRRACEKGSAMACFQLGDRADKVGHEADAKVYFKHACTLQHAVACQLIGGEPPQTLAVINEEELAVHYKLDLPLPADFSCNAQGTVCGPGAAQTAPAH